MTHASAQPCHVAPATEDDIRWVAALGHRVYGGLDVIPEATMVAWFRANPDGFSTFWYGSERVGNFDVLPLRATVMDRFAGGTLLERDITGDDLIPPHESHSIRDLHWESIVIEPAFVVGRNRMIKLFAQTYLDTLTRLCPVDQIGNVYAIAASGSGMRLLQRMGLSPIAEASGRLDAHPLYRGNVASYRAAMSDMFG